MTIKPPKVTRRRPQEVTGSDPINKPKKIKILSPVLKTIKTD